MPKVPLKKQRKYPHMMPADIELWELFLEQFPDEFDSFIYDLHVGEGIKPPENIPEGTKRQIQYLTQKRIDAVGYKDKQPTIIEVKPDAGPSALGQLFTYGTLWLKKFPPPPYPKLAVVSDFIDNDMKFVFNAYRVKMYIVKLK